MLAHRDTALVRVAAVTRAVELMRTYPAGPHQLRDLARAGRYSPFHFHRIFREVTGLTPASYLAAVRMAHARRLLVHSNLTVAQVSREVGYQSPGAFTGQFGRLAGVSPQRFRHLMGAIRGVTVGALLPVLGTHAELEWQHQTLAPGPAQGRRCRVTLTGGVAGSALVMVGLLPAGSLGPGPRWRVATSDAGCLSLPSPPGDGAYSAFVVAVPAYACLVDAFVDQAPGGYLIGATEARFPADHEHIQVEVRQPRRTDPPVLGAAPVQWLAYRTIEMAAAPRPRSAVPKAGAVRAATRSTTAGHSGGPGLIWRSRA